MKHLRHLFVAVLFAPAAGAAESQYQIAAAPAADQPRQLEKITVTSERYKRVPPPEVPPFLLGFPQLTMNFGFGWPESLDRFVVTAARIPQAPENVAATVKILDAGALQASPALTADGAMRSVPGFSLFRRSDSLSANPTAQGVSLRGLGPSGASRSLVLYDGVPLNDPFGGWVAWSKLPREGLYRTEIVPGGGATVWGNAALGGVVQVFAMPVRTSLVVLDKPPQPVALGSQGSGRLALSVGELGTRSLELAFTVPAGPDIAQLLGRTFATDGYRLVAPERRGPIDVSAWSRHRWFQGRWRHSFAGKLDLTATVRGFEEQRGNGTPYTRNGTRERFVSAGLAGQPSREFSWKAIAYAQDQSFASTFSSVNATRTAETPASDQFAVPAVSLGAAWTGTWRHDATARTNAGADLRTVRGETREDFSYVAGRFTRRRVAGGRQEFGGLFGLHERPLAPGLWLTAGGRLDWWHEANGHRRETDRDTGSLLRHDIYPAQQDAGVSANAGLAWTPRRAWRFHTNAQHAFRRPTLNELYRPFRQGANITEANPALRTERVVSGEVGAEWILWRTLPPPLAPADQPGVTTSQGRGFTTRTKTARGSSEAPKPFAALTLGATAFFNELRDAVGNVTIARGPGTFPIVGAVAAGGVGRQRLSLDRLRVQGVEFSAKWTPRPDFTLTGEMLCNDATVRRATVAPGLVGKRVAQVPRRSAAAGFVWRAPGRITLAPRLRVLGRQFEDDENQMLLGRVAIVDAAVSRPLTKHLEVYLSGENLGQARIETGRSLDGVVNVGTPRLVVLGLRGNW